MVPLAGCNRDTNPVHAERDAQGNTHVTVDNQQVNRNVDQADQSLKKTGDQIKDGANQAGAAIQRGAEKVGNQLQTKVVPAAKEALSNANITAKVKTRLAQDPAINALGKGPDRSVEDLHPLFEPFQPLRNAWARLLNHLQLVSDEMVLS